MTFLYQKSRCLIEAFSLHLKHLLLFLPTTMYEGSEIFRIIQDINKRGTTILLVEQNAKMALGIADRAYVLETGKIVLEGTGEELAASERVRKAYLGG